METGFIHQFAGACSQSEWVRSQVQARNPTGLEEVPILWSVDVLNVAF